MGISIHPGSILDVRVDTIVNPANNHLNHCGGLAAAIARAAAPLASFTSMDQVYYHGGVGDDPVKWQQDKKWTVEQARHPLVPTGGAGWTSAGRLDYRGIVHAVGPVWGGGHYLEPALLASAHESAMRVAARESCQSIAFPAISCGIFGYPVEQAAGIAVATVRAGMEVFGLKRVVFALFEDEHVACYTNALAATA